MVTANVTNVSTAGWDEPPEVIPEVASMVAVSVGIIIIVCGVLGNLVLIVAIFACRSLHTTTNYIVLSLAITDLLTLLGPDAIVLSTYIHRRWIYDSTLCAAMLLAVSVGQTVAVTHTILIAYTRLLYISRPLVYNKLRQRSRLVLILTATYVVPFLIVGSAYLGRLFGPDNLIFDIRAMVCIYTEHRNSLVSTYICLTLATTLMTYIYVRAFYLISCSLRSVEQQPATSSHVVGTSILTPGRTRLLRREFTFIKSIAVIYTIFLLTYVPVPILFDVDRQHSLPWGVRIGAVITSWVSPSTNYLVFGFVNLSFRKAFHKLWKDLIPCSQRIIPHMPPAAPLRWWRSSEENALPVPVLPAVVYINTVPDPMTR